MKKELIDKLLNEQTTPEEEHLIAQELRQKEDIERWLIEDETAMPTNSHNARYCPCCATASNS